MTKEYYRGNRERLYAGMKDGSILVLFSGSPVRKTSDEFYPFYTNRNFLYLTGLDQQELHRARPPTTISCCTGR